MTKDEYKAYFTGVLEAAGIKLPDPSGHVEKAIDQGLKDFCGASDWNFKHQEYPLAITSSAESYALPDNFEGFTSFREKDTDNGLRLVFFPYSRFMDMIPKLSAHTTGTPQSFTVYYDKTTDNWRVMFYPQPSGSMTIYCGIVTGTVTSPDLVPDKFQGCLESFISKHVYPPGSPQRVTAYREAMSELRRCEVLDNADASHIDVMGTTGDELIYNKRWWND